MAHILTVVERSRSEVEKIKGSRFFATVAPIGSAEAALHLRSQLHLEFSDATHHCWAWRGDHRDAFRYSDDGEPNGSAGKPILAAIDGRQLQHVAVVVTRYFGGVKLGTGGLVRAYGSAAAAALNDATILKLPIVTTLQIEHPYSLCPIIDSVLHSYGLTPKERKYETQISLTVDLPIEQVDIFIVEVTEATAGTVVPFTQRAAKPRQGGDT